MKKNADGHFCPGSGAGSPAEAFSLVEVTIAIGIFAFVVVALMGLFPAALRQREQAEAETRAVLIAQQIFETFQAAGGVSNVVLLRGENDVVLTNLSYITNPSTPLVFGFEERGTEPGVHYTNNPAGMWSDQTVEQDETAKARVMATVITNNLLRMTVDVGQPANLPADKRRIETFSTLLYTP